MVEYVTYLEASLIKVVDLVIKDTVSYLALVSSTNLNYALIISRSSCSILCLSLA
jgi:hypothetical protein